MLSGRDRTGGCCGATESGNAQENIRRVNFLFPREASLVDKMREWIEMASLGIEVLAVAVIVGSVAFGSLRFLLDLSRQAADPYRTYKDLIGRALLLGLEFLVAADVIRTVALELTPRNIAMLGALVVIRTFLSWSVVVETEGHWPWQSGPGQRH